MIQLKPFHPIEKPIQISADVKVFQNRLDFKFELSDPEHLMLDGPHLLDAKSRPGPRVHNLWKTTCFEAFWREPKGRSYWEFNLSSAGSWNVYQFDEYRRPHPPRESEQYTLSSFELAGSVVRCTLQSQNLLSQLDFSLAAVIELNTKTLSYWAAHHASGKPDFHHPDSFTIHRGKNEVRS